MEEVPLPFVVGGAVFVDGGAPSVAGGVDVTVLDDVPEVLGGSAGGGTLAGGGVEDSGETVWIFMFPCEEPVPVASLPKPEAEVTSCGPPKFSGGFTSGAPVCAAMDTSGALFITPMARCTSPG